MTEQDRMLLISIYDHSRNNLIISIYNHCIDVGSYKTVDRGLYRQLVKEGLIEIHPSNNLSWTIYLTDKGKEMAEKECALIAIAR
jgi:hypothetical protein